MPLKKILSLLLLCMLTAFASQRASAGLTYEVADVADTTVGVNRMKYIYHLDGSFSAFYGFTLIYDSARYADLNLLVPLPSDWFASITQPDPVLPADGLLMYMALADVADASGTFEVDFDWLATASPGAQPYELFDDQFNVVGASRTRPTGRVDVPEPAPLALMVGGLFMLFRRQHKRRPPSPHPFARA